MKARPASAPAPATRAASRHAGHRDQLADFLQAIDTGGPPRVDGREGRKAVEIIRAIYHSARTGQAVRLPLRRRPAAS